MRWSAKPIQPIYHIWRTAAGSIVAHRCRSTDGGGPILITSWYQFTKDPDVWSGKWVLAGFGEFWISAGFKSRISGNIIPDPRYLAYLAFVAKTSAGGASRTPWSLETRLFLCHLAGPGAVFHGFSPIKLKTKCLEGFHIPNLPFVEAKLPPKTIQTSSTSKNHPTTIPKKPKTHHTCIFSSHFPAIFWGGLPALRLTAGEWRSLRRAGRDPGLCDPSLAHSSAQSGGTAGGGMGMGEDEYITVIYI